MKRPAHKPAFDLIHIIEASMQFPDSGDFAVIKKDYAKLIISEITKYYELDSSMDALSDLFPDSGDLIGDAAREINRLRMIVSTLQPVLKARLNISQEQVDDLLDGLGIIEKRKGGLV